jgi:hypothetical protein
MLQTAFEVADSALAEAGQLGELQLCQATRVAILA